MPGGGADLGFVAVAVVVAAVIWYSARRRWRMTVARTEEVRRLAWLAAEEAARAEAEAVALAYMAPPLPSSLAPDDGGAEGGDEIEVGNWAMPPALVQVLPQCAVCYRHTTTRCSRCKAVRYCSGKCQIIHWRQGHKDECHPPSIDDHNNDGDCVSNLKHLQTIKSDPSENNVDLEIKAQPKPLETFSVSPSHESNSSSAVSNEDHIEVKPFVDIPRTESTSDSSADSLSSTACSTFSGLLETSDEASSKDDPHVYEKMEKSSRDISPEDTIPAVHTSKENLKKVPIASTGSSVNNVSHTNNSEQKVQRRKSDDAGCRSGGPSGSSSVSSAKCTNARPPKDDDGCRSGGPSGSSSVSSAKCTNARPPKDDGEFERDHVQVVAGSSCEVPSNYLPSEMRYAKKDSSHGIASSEGIAHSNHRATAAFRTVNSSSVASRSADVLLQKPKIARSSSSLSFVDPESSNSRTRFVSRDLSSNNDRPPALFTKSVETAASVPNGVSDLKTSVRRVVQQLKSSHLSKHSSGPRSDISQKYKTLFPYDVFVKLYNCEKMEMRPCGLTNCGNSCYANAVLQCLEFTRPLMSYHLQGLHAKICPRKDWCFTCEFASLLVKAKQGQSPLSPIGILSHIHNIGSNLGHGREEDAHEFLRYAIDTMQSVCLKEAGINAAGSSAEETTLIQLIFGGYLRSKIKCTRCRGTSERHERMMDLNVEIHGDIGTLEEALARFTATEILDGENKYHCSRCKTYERAKKKLTVLEAPNVLTIALKRFQSGKFGKLNKAVRFPEILDLAPYMSGTDDKSPVYSLYAVVVHQDIMNAAFSGHYVCYVKSTQGKWYKTDDSRVKPVDIGRVLTKNAYMLFYARCSPRAPSLIRSAISHEHLKPRRKGKDTLLSSHAPSVTRQRSCDCPPYRSHGHHHSSSLLANLFNERLPFPRTDSSSDSSSLLSCSDEGSCSTESTRDSTSTEELSECIFGGSGRFSQSNSSVFSEDSDGFLSSPLFSRHCFAGGGEGLSYGERGDREEVGLGGRESPHFLYSDTQTATTNNNNNNNNNQSRKLTGDCTSRGTKNEVEPNVLIRRSSTSRERRTQTFY